ncbi:MAG: uracil-DNA glycosylase [Kofleriaceae bacterium]
MRIMLATTVALLVSGCTDAAVDEVSGDDIDYGDDGKEDSAGATLCDPLPAASKQLCLQIPNNGWRNALRAELTAPYFEPLAAAVAKARAVDAASDKVEDNVYPAEIDTFAALRRVSPGRVKAVVVGQDPYIGVGQAMGMSFSVAPGLAVPPSLDNIYAELVREAGDPALAHALPNGFVCPANGDLTAWARQGVFLINAILTVRHGAAGSHADFGWQSLTDAILAVVRDRNKDQATAYLLWGAFARAKVSLIGTTNPKVLILEAAHPSPLAHGFYGNGHFAKANTFLVDQGRTPIEWSLPAPAAGTTTKHSCNAR